MKYLNLAIATWLGCQPVLFLSAVTMPAIAAPARSKVQTQAAIDGITKGLTRAQVKAKLGIAFREQKTYWEYWVGSDRNSVRIYFDSSGRVTKKETPAG